MNFGLDGGMASCGERYSRVVCNLTEKTMHNGERTRILFVCIGNSCRSPMAEAIALRDAADVIEAASAGLARLGFVAPQTKRTLAENGYSTEGLESKPIVRPALDAADLVINMSGRPRERVFPDIEKVEDWEVEDPYGEDAEVYQRILEEITRRVKALAERLRHQNQRVPAKSSERNRD
jgi:arsenate reductase (thioredoxin)